MPQLFSKILLNLKINKPIIMNKIISTPLENYKGFCLEGNILFFVQQDLLDSRLTFLGLINSLALADGYEIICF